MGKVDLCQPKIQLEPLSCTEKHKQHCRYYMDTGMYLPMKIQKFVWCLSSLTLAKKREKHIYRTSIIFALQHNRHNHHQRHHHYHRHHHHHHHCQKMLHFLHTTILTM
jgi:hypothetical protein